MNSFEQLPNDIHYCICEYLNAFEKVNVSQATPEKRDLYCAESWKKLGIIHDVNTTDTLLDDTHLYSAREVPLRVFLNPKKYQRWFLYQCVEEIHLKDDFRYEFTRLNIEGKGCCSFQELIKIYPCLNEIILMRPIEWSSLEQFYNSEMLLNTPEIIRKDLVNISTILDSAFFEADDIIRTLYNSRPSTDLSMITGLTTYISPTIIKILFDPEILSRLRHLKIPVLNIRFFDQIKAKLCLFTTLRSVELPNYYTLEQNRPDIYEIISYKDYWDLFDSLPESVTNISMDLTYRADFNLLNRNKKMQTVRFTSATHNILEAPRITTLRLEDKRHIAVSTLVDSANFSHIKTLYASLNNNWEHIQNSNNALNNLTSLHLYFDKISPADPLLLPRKLGSFNNLRNLSLICTEGLGEKWSLPNFDTKVNTFLEEIWRHMIVLDDSSTGLADYLIAGKIQNLLYEYYTTHKLSAVLAEKISQMLTNIILDPFENFQANRSVLSGDSNVGYILFLSIWEWLFWFVKGLPKLEFLGISTNHEFHFSPMLENLLRHSHVISSNKPSLKQVLVTTHLRWNSYLNYYTTSTLPLNNKCRMIAPDPKTAKHNEDNPATFYICYNIQSWMNQHSVPLMNEKFKHVPNEIQSRYLDINLMNCPDFDGWI